MHAALQKFNLPHRGLWEDATSEVFHAHLHGRRWGWEQRFPEKRSSPEPGLFRGGRRLAGLEEAGQGSWKPRGAKCALHTFLGASLPPPSQRIVGFPGESVIPAGPHPGGQVGTRSGSVL